MRFSARFSTCCISQLKCMLYLTSVVRAVSSRYISCYTYIPISVHALSSYDSACSISPLHYKLSSHFSKFCIFPLLYKLYLPMTIFSSVHAVHVLYLDIFHYMPYLTVNHFRIYCLQSSLHAVYIPIIHYMLSIPVIFNLVFLFTTYCIPYLLHVCLPIIHFMPCLPLTHYMLYF